jgi:glycosyltransferase involved in cell wall biosynthesis
MRILWIPHAPLGFGGTRAEHLMKKLAKRHEVYALSCHVYRRLKSLRYLSDLLQYRVRQSAGGYYEILLKRIPRVEWLNTLLTNRSIMREARRRCCDVVVLSPNPYLIGYVNFARLRQDIPIVCDYLDGTSWGSQDDNFERHYVESSDSVICVSRLLTQQARAVNDFCFFIPNGVDLARFSAYRRAHTAGECKRALGIDPDTFVISVIGMTCSSRLYFVDAALALARSGRKLLLLLVGPSPLFPEILRRAQGDEAIVRIEGTIPHEEIMRYYMATDIGLYTVDDSPKPVYEYYHRASPIKIFEYSAMGKPVVVAPWLDEVARCALPNVTFCEADAESLATHISLLADNGPCLVEANLSPYDWTMLAGQVEDVLAEVIAKKQTKRRTVSLSEASHPLSKSSRRLHDTFRPETE